MDGIFQVPALSSLTAFDVNRAGQYEGVCASLYDSATYAAAGQTQLNFFQLPIGQSGKTLENTNMKAAGQLPANNFFFCTGIELQFLPNMDVASLGAPAAQEFANDVWDFSRYGYLDFFIGSKSYLTEAPLNKFPPKTGLIVSGHMSDATTAAAALNNRVTYTNLGGRPYELKPGILLTPNQNFSVSLNWGTARAISTTANVFVSLTGFLYRQSQ